MYANTITMRYSDKLLGESAFRPSDIDPFSFAPKDPDSHDCVSGSTGDIKRHDSSYVPNSASDQLRSQYRSLLVKHFADAEKAENIMNDTEQSPARHSRLVYNRQDDYLGAASQELTVQDNSPIKSPRTL